MMISRRAFGVHFCSVLFGLGAWVTLNGVWVELPQLVAHLPEGWNLPSYLSVIVQLANIGPLTYSFIGYLNPSAFTDVMAVTITTTIGATACLLLSFFWDRTLFAFGQLRSVALLPLVFLMAIVDCTSSVLFLPFMASFKKKYLISYLVGEGLSGFVPSVLALVQGVGGNPECRNSTSANVTIPYTNLTKPALEPFYPEPLFSTKVFFILLFLLDVSSLLSFFILNYLPYLKSERVSIVPRSAIERDQEYSDAPIAQISTRDNPSPDFSSLVRKDSQRHEHQAKPSNIKITYYLLFLQAWLCALSNGVFTSVQSFSCLPYGNRVFHLSVSLSTMANPVACFIAIFLPTKNLKLINLFVVIGTAISCYIMTTAVMSPTPPLVSQLSGEILIISSWILFSGIFSYAKASVATILRDGGRKALFWCGVWTQIGSCIGSIIMFVLINNLNLFQSFYPCV